MILWGTLVQSCGRHLGIIFLKDKRVGCFPTFSGLSLVGDHSGALTPCVASLSEPRKLLGRERSGCLKKEAVCQMTSGEAKGMMGPTCLLSASSMPSSLLQTLHAFPICSFHLDHTHEVGGTTLIRIPILNVRH